MLPKIRYVCTIIDCSLDDATVAATVTDGAAARRALFNRKMHL